MPRRTVLRKTAALVAGGAVAGCLQQQGEDLPPTRSPTSTTSTTPTETEPQVSTPSPTPPEESELVDSEFTVVGVESGTRHHEAAVSVDGLSVVVEGTLPGANGCYTAELVSSTYEAERLVPVVQSVASDDGETSTTACTRAIVEIRYRAVFDFVGALPETVLVVHRAMGERTGVTEAELVSAGTTPTGTVH
jgi:hypothetical protein